jgi:hypothetical protein
MLRDIVSGMEFEGICSEDDQELAIRKDELVAAFKRCNVSLIVELKQRYPMDKVSIGKTGPLP